MKSESDITLKQVFREFWLSVRAHRLYMWGAVFGIVITPVISVIIPLYYRQFFNILNTSTDKAAAQAALVHVIVVILVLNGIYWVGSRVSSVCNNFFESRIMADLRQRAFAYLIGHSYTFFTNNFTGSLTQRVNRYARAFERLWDNILLNVIPLAISIVGIAIAVWFVNPLLSLVIIVWLLIFMVVNYFFSRSRIKHDLERAKADTEATAVLSDVITNHNAVELFNGADREIGTFGEVTDRQARITKESWDVAGRLDGVQAIFTIGMEFLIFYFSIRLWVNGSITLGVFVMLQAYLIGLGGRLWTFSRIIRDFYESFADAKEMVEILILPHQIKDVPGAGSLKVKEGVIEFKETAFAFNETRSVLENVSFKVPSGQKIALVGPSGAGKSTLVRLLLRLYDVESGGIFIDDQNIASVTQESLHQSIAFVPQDPVLFHRTLRENIRYGRPEATDEEVVHAAHLAHCDEFIKDLPKGYDTFVGERGIKLSGGERQRVAIARAILKNAPILVLDEATSSLDSHSEMLIQDALEKLMRGKTVIVIAHRLSTIRKMDRIIVLDHGKIIQDGTHDELAKIPGMYQKLWNLQAGGFLVEDLIE